MIYLFRTSDGPVVRKDGKFYRIASGNWDQLISRDDAFAHLRRQIDAGQCAQVDPVTQPLAPIVNQEVWAAGVTYRRSKEARMEESKSAGGGNFYDRVYWADRPELFYKASAHRVSGPGQPVRIRSDSKWNVPEPELTLVISAGGQIIGYTIGNDMSSRDIEGENPLYLPQAKVYDGCCALGPCILLTEGPLPVETAIKIQIRRDGGEVFSGQTALSQIKRELASLVRYLYMESSFPAGCFLLTGTGIVPPDGFTLRSGDEISIEIPAIGVLENRVL